MTRIGDKGCLYILHNSLIYGTIFLDLVVKARYLCKHTFWLCKRIIYHHNIKTNCMNECKYFEIAVHRIKVAMLLVTFSHISELSKG
uniref:Uncharacterized protein n=1 Tax=Pararge aegeria TaxID=116150 RepID=S4PI43_9NEOP